MGEVQAALYIIIIAIIFWGIIFILWYFDIFCKLNLTGGIGCAKKEGDSCKGIGECAYEYACCLEDGREPQEDLGKPATCMKTGPEILGVRYCPKAKIYGKALGDDCLVSEDCQNYGWGINGKGVLCCKKDGSDKIIGEKGICMLPKDKQISCPNSVLNTLCPIDEPKCKKRGERCVPAPVSNQCENNDVCCTEGDNLPEVGKMGICRESTLVTGPSGIKVYYCKNDPLAAAANTVLNLGKKQLGETCSTAVECDGEQSLACCNENDTDLLIGTSGKCRVGRKEGGIVFCKGSSVAPVVDAATQVFKRKEGESCGISAGTCDTGLFCCGDGKCATKCVGTACFTNVECGGGTKCCGSKCSESCGAVGDPCNVLADCIDGACCGTAGAKTCQTGILNVAGSTRYCTNDPSAPKTDGNGPCTSDLECQYGLKCCGNKCSSNCGSVGAPCNVLADCINGACCGSSWPPSGSKTCQTGILNYAGSTRYCTNDPGAPKLIGQRCGLPTDCKYGLNCCGGECTDKVCGKDGSPCSGDIHCTDKNYCKNGICVDQGELNDSCSRDYECETNKYVCKSGSCKLGWNQICMKDAACASGNCEAPSCVLDYHSCGGMEEYPPGSGTKYCTIKYCETVTGSKDGGVYYRCGL